MNKTGINNYISLSTIIYEKAKVVNTAVFELTIEDNYYSNQLIELGYKHINKYLLFNFYTDLKELIKAYEEDKKDDDYIWDRIIDRLILLLVRHSEITIDLFETNKNNVISNEIKHLLLVYIKQY